MSQPILQRLLRVAILAVFVVFAFWFLGGPNGLLSIGRRKARERRLRADISEFKQQIAERQQRREWLANPDSASLRARELLGDLPDSTPSPR
jgi:Tfp pilus assembly protein PilO